ncbi:MAG: pantoate--beta-alanine ligase [Planctomycetes bacterium RBG_13_62_9]|nr:MAG: pantoate--beta-alanine ligase [Planctomycetes bacterium RBG_13_62_9]
MQVAKTIGEIRGLVAQARAAAKTVGLMPTMGALHAGHISLIDAARGRCGYVVVSIFVNPTQFGPTEDLNKYPRPFEKDLEVCEKHGVDAVFAPTVAQMYPRENLTWVNVERLTDRLCGQLRPGHFRGVATVCAKLFNIVCPDVAFFGQKDAQQALVIRRMVADLNAPLEIVVCPTVREPDGLATSSRNQYLSPGERKDAAQIYKSLQQCRELIEAGQRDAELIRARMREILQRVPSMSIEYVSLSDAETLEELQDVRGRVLAAVAIRMKSARLIDNILVDTPAK